MSSSDSENEQLQTSETQPEQGTTEMDNAIMQKLATMAKKNNNSRRGGICIFQSEINDDDDDQQKNCSDMQ